MGHALHIAVEQSETVEVQEAGFVRTRGGPLLVPMEGCNWLV